MALETIPFKVFMSVPHWSWISGVDLGLTFFAGTGAVLLGLVVAEKMGFNINQTAVRWTVRVIAAVFILYAVFNTGFLTHLVFGR